MHFEEVDSSSEITELISIGMSSTVHFYQEDVTPEQLAMTLVSMANTDGGTIVLGASPYTGELTGVRDPHFASEKIFQAAILSSPTLVLPVPRQVTASMPGDQALVKLMLVSVPSGLPNVHSLNGRYYSREGSQDMLIPASRLYRLLQERGALQFESQPVEDAGVYDLDPEKILAYAQVVGDKTIKKLDKANELLVKRGCLKREGDKLQVTYAGLLLFGIHPQQWLPSATILAGRFPGSGMSDSFIKRDITGSLLDQLNQAEEFVRANLKTVVRLVGFRHQEVLEYPLEAVRELLVNAVAHRDYNLQGDTIHLNIFSNHLVITSPGTLPGPVTLDNLLEARFARNAVISQVLSDLGYVERLGYGLDRVVEVTRNEGLPPPQFEEVGGSFRVTLFASQPVDSDGKKLTDLSLYAQLELNPRQQLAITQLVRHKRITSHEYQALCPEVHAETLRRDLADLVSKGILMKVGDKKATYYILK